tara:strand:- start:2084 stop:3193 length:1110 start_codon:yes stop_codon:yes gene_type:complete
MKAYKVIISGGGTGGHIFPALAIANGIIEKKPEAEILFVGAKGRMEMEKVPQAGFNIVGLDVVGIQRSISISSIIKNLKFPFLLIKSLTKAKQIVKNFNPNIVIGVGGYASGPTLRMANKLNIPTLIQEQNSYAGLTNKWLSKNASKICVAYSKMDKFFSKEKIIVTGNPVRKDISDLKTKKEEAFTYFKISNNEKVILILGGSLGAKSINEGLLNSLKLIKDKPIKLIWQVGKRYISSISESLKKSEFANVTATAFINRMDLAYAAADVIVSRAGALSISEITLVGKASILVPSPNVSEDHQTKNAMALVENKAAILVKDSSTDSLLEKALYLLSNEKEYTLIAKNAKLLGKPNATEDIVDQVLKLTN